MNVIEAVPQRPHVEVGSIEARRMSSSSANKRELYEAIQEVGARHGCDAVRIVGPIESSRYGFQAACIVFKAAAQPQVPAAQSSPGPLPAPSSPTGTASAEGGT